MFIDSADDKRRPPSGGPCADQWTKFEKGNHTSPSWRRATLTPLASINIALLTEGRGIPLLVPINIALLMEGRGHLDTGSINVALLTGGPPV
jgi:hypothetical protein